VSSNKVSQSVKQFIFEAIDSIEQLEVLLLLHYHKDRTWSAGEVSQELRGNMDSASKRLKDLQRLGLLSSPDELRYTYHPKSSELDALVVELSETYKQRRYAVIELIFSHPVDAIQSFSDAFKIKKDGNDHG
jgi:hypothetical protein